MKTLILLKLLINENNVKNKRYFLNISVNGRLFFK